MSLLREEYDAPRLRRKGGGSRPFRAAMCLELLQYLDCFKRYHMMQVGIFMIRVFFSKRAGRRTTVRGRRVRKYCTVPLMLENGTGVVNWQGFGFAARLKRRIAGVVPLRCRG